MTKPRTHTRVMAVVEFRGRKFWQTPGEKREAYITDGFVVFWARAWPVGTTALFERRKRHVLRGIAYEVVLYISPPMRS